MDLRKVPTRPIREATPPRLAWLMINLCTALLAAATVNFFEGTIERVAALAVFMPMVAGMGGNAGIQTITLVVRFFPTGRGKALGIYNAIKGAGYVLAPPAGGSRPGSWSRSPKSCHRATWRRWRAPAKPSSGVCGCGPARSNSS